MKRRIRELITAVLFVAVVVSSMGVAAADYQEQGEEKTVRVAVLNYPNYIEMDENGRVSGYAYEYLEEIARHTGWKYEYVKMSFASALQALEDGVIDVLPGIQYTEERAKVMDFSEYSMGEGGTVLCVLPENREYAFNDFSSFGGMKIAVLKGSVRQELVRERFEEYGVEPEFVEYTSDAASKVALLKGNVQAVMMSSIRCEDDLKIVARVDNASLYFALNKADPLLKLQMDKAMENIYLAEPYYDAKLDEKYYGNVLGQVSLSDSEIAYVENADVIKVAIFDGVKPVEYYDENTRSYEGIIVDTYQLISEYTGLKFEFVPREERDKLEGQLLSGEVQLIGDVAKDEGIAEYFGVQLTNSFYESSITAVVNTSVANYREDSMKIALYARYPFYAKLIGNLGYKDITYYNSYEECIKAVNKGTADMALIPTYCEGRLIDHTYLKKITSFILPDSNYEFCVGIPESADKELYSIMNKAIVCINQEERNRLIIDNVISNRVHEDWMDFWIDNLLVILGTGFVLITLVAAGMAYLLRGRNKANQDLQKMIEEAEYANRAKNDFLSRMSHDMRTPMNAIIGLSALGGDEAESDNSREYFQNIHLSADFLLGLINDVLETSKLESNAFSLHPSAYSIGDFYSQVESTILPLCKQKDITFRFETDEQNEKYVWLDYLRFEQVIFNLLTNAVKFTPTGGTVSLEIRNTGRTLTHISRQFIIRDNGIGMTPQFMQHMYEPFAQEHTTLSERTDGSGLGLTIVKKLVELMDGTIQCRNLPEGGTEFTLEFTMPICKEPEEVKRNIRQKGRSEYHLEGKKVLLCEDHPLNTQIVVKLLERQGIRVDCAENGEDGVKLFAKSEIGEYAAILMDIRMPVLDGLAATVKIREMQRADAKAVPIIAMTANAYDEDKQKSKEAGMNEHLAKPVEPKILYDTLEKYVQQQAVERKEAACG